MDDTASAAHRQAHHDRSGGILHYGSAPGELAACLRNVGLVRRTESFGMLVEGSSLAIDTATQRLASIRVEVGGAVRLGDVWWCRPEGGRVLLVAPLASRAHTLRLLEQHSRHTIGLRVDPARRLGVGTLVGPRLHDLMRATRVYGVDGDPRTTSPCVDVPVAGRPVTWVLQSDSTVTCCYDPADADAVHHALEVAGHAFGIARVGHEAFDRFSLLERQRRPLLRI